MIMTSKRKLTSAVAILCALMILIGIFPMNLFGGNNEVEAALPSDYNSTYVYFDTTGTLWQGEKIYIHLQGWNGFAAGTALSSNNNIYYWNASTYTDGNDPYLIFAIKSTWDEITEKTQRTEVYSISINNAKGKIFTIDGTTSSNGYYNTKLSADSDGSIKPSIPEEPTHKSTIINSGAVQDTGNVKADGYATYLVGEYQYTGDYITFKSDFYDYLSDYEVENGRGNITNSNSAGWTDQYKYFNSMISKNAVEYETVGSKKLIFKPDSSAANKTKYTYAYAYITNSSGDVVAKNYEWPGQELSTTGNTTINFSSAQVDDNSEVRIIFNTGSGSANNITGRYPLDNEGGIVLQLGNTYSFNFDGGYPSVVNAGNIRNTLYNYPLYFGCFYKQFDTGDTTGDNNSYYTNAAKNEILTMKSVDNTNNPIYSIYNNFYWLTSIAIRGADYLYTSVEGLVNEELINGNIADATSKTILPYFNYDWFENNKVTNSSGNKVTLASCWTDVDFPFYKVQLTKYNDGVEKRDSTGNYPTYWQFNSRDFGSLYLDTTGTNGTADSGAVLKEHSTAVKSQPAEVNGVEQQTKGFYPYNNSASNNGKQNNLGFGTKFTIQFTLTEDGKINGIPTTFEFMGDDDVWVFVDGNLVLDMGGAHKDAYGKIDFSNLTTTLNSTVTVDSNNRDNFNTALDTSASNHVEVKKNDTFEIEKVNGKYDTTEVHTLTMYYMERGMFESDLFVRFNFQRQNSFSVENKVDVSAVSDGLQNRTLQAANLDVFDYTLKNSADNANEFDAVGGTGLKYESGSYNTTNGTAVRTVNSISGTTTILDGSTAGSTAGHFSNSSSGGSLISVSSTGFERYDEFFTNKDVLYVTGLTDSSGKFGLIYGQTASFNKQFYGGSTMQVIQNNSLRVLSSISLSSANSLEAKNPTAPSSTRSAKTYYKTIWEISDIHDEKKTSPNRQDMSNTAGVAVSDDPSNTNLKTFTYQNFNPGTYDYILGVNMHVKYTNSVRVGNLKVTKKLVESSDQSTQDFVINLNLTDILGQSGVNAQGGDSITYCIDNGADETATFNSNGIASVSIKKEQTITFKNIPVGTKYTVSEEAQGNFKLNSISPSTGTISEGTTDNAPLVTVNNERNLGSLKLNKSLTAETGTNITDADKEKTFSFTVTLESTDFDLVSYYTDGTANYSDTIFPNDWKKVDNSNKKITKTFNVSQNNPVTISNIPYGTKYTVTETVPSGWTQKTTTGTTGIINSSAATATITNKKEVPQGATLIIQKLDRDNNSIKLSGARFQLYDTETGGNAVGTVKTTDANGKAKFSDLDPNTTYWVEEIEAPAGYQKLSVRIEVQTGNAGTEVTRDVRNVQIILPEAGGFGEPFNFVLFGAIAIALAGGILLLNKKYAFLHIGKSSKEVR